MASLRSYGVSILNGVIFSNIFIALCAVAQTLLTYKLLHLPASGYMLIFQFAATVIIYNISTLAEPLHKLKRSKYKRVQWVVAHYRGCVLFTLLAAATCASVFICCFNWPARLVMVVTGIIALGYSMPVLRYGHVRISLRAVPGLKLFIIAIAWALSVVLLPVVAAGAYSSFGTLDIIFLCIKRMLFVMAITIPFDIRDMYQDNYYRLKTIPILIGERKAYLLSLLMLALQVGIWLSLSNTIDAAALAFTCSSLIAAFIIYSPRLRHNEYYFFLALDGTLMLQYLLLLVFSHQFR